jgi:hypothetical protein
MCRAAQIAPHLDGGWRSRSWSAPALPGSPHRVPTRFGGVATRAARAPARFLVHAPPAGGRPPSDHRSPARARCRSPAPMSPTPPVGISSLAHPRTPRCRSPATTPDVVDGRSGSDATSGRPRLRVRRHLARSPRAWCSTAAATIVRPAPPLRAHVDRERGRRGITVPLRRQHEPRDAIRRAPRPWARRWSPSGMRAPAACSRSSSRGAPPAASRRRSIRCT